MKEFLTKKRIFLIGFIFLSIIASDQWTKVLAKKYLRYSQPKIYLGDFFRLQYAENKGAFLSLGANMSDEMRFWVFTVMVFIFLLGGIFFLIKKQTTLYHTIGLSLILSGGVGNIIDRAMAGRVVDFMNMGIGPLRTGIFNIADIAISVGAVMLILDEFLTKRREKQEKESQV